MTRREDDINRGGVKKVVVLFFVFYALTKNFGYSQAQYNILDNDTVTLSEGDIIIINKKKYRVRKDTSFFIPQNVKYKVRKFNYGNADAFLDTLKNNPKPEKAWHKALQLLLKAEENGANRYHNQRSETPFVPYQRKIINKIKYVRLDPFGPTIYDTTKTADTWIAKIGNQSQFKTNERVIKDNILFKTGDRVEPDLFSDNERILRSLPYIMDAKILVEDIDEQGDSVNVTVITKDIWSEAFGMSTTDFSSGQFDIWNNNILGFGKEIRHSIFWDNAEDPNLGYEGQFKAKNLSGSFMDLKLEYLDKFGTKSYYGQLERKFFSSNIKTAGGLEIGKIKSLRDIRIGDTVLTDKFYDLNFYDIWLGRAFPIPSKNLLSKQNMAFVLSGRIINNTFNERPMETNENFFHRFHQRTTYLGSVAFSKQSFRRSSLIYSYGRVEDVPYGALASLTGGVEIDEYYTRPYFGLHVSNARAFLNGSYFYSGGNFGSYFKNNDIEQGVFNFDALYFTKLLRHGTYKSRLFAKTRFSRGINRYDDELLSINNKEGIIGLRSEDLYGNQKLVFNFEAVTFTPYYLYGFRVAFYLFSDLGWVCNTSQRAAYHGHFYTGHGIGFRFKNEKLAFNTIQLRLAWYPRIPSDANPSYIQFSGENRLRIENFFAKSPEIFDFE